MSLKLFYKISFVLSLCIYISGNVCGQICVGDQGEVTWSYWRQLPDDLLGELYADEYYPNTPDGTRILNSVQSPVNFDNYFGSTIRGFISSPVTENIIFNITGDDDVLFFLSSNEDPDNLIEEAFIYGYTGREEHDKYPEQTTRSINLLANQFYYFELHHVEGGGGDHSALWWKTSFTGLTDWNFVSSQYIANVGCEEDSCPIRGTSCDDGDETTTDDIEDGYCNCMGVPENANDCIGDRSTIEAYYYDNIPGGDIDDLYEDPDFPAMPNRYELLDMMGVGERIEADSFGTLVQGYISVPISGDYQFNITSNSDGIFFLSSNDDPALKQTHQILNTSSTGATEHDRFIYQSTAPLFLEKGKFYFFEINHKESTWTEHYSIFWKTPFSADGLWKRIPSVYLFDYACEIACMTQGVACDDGDPFTNNDAFNDNCMCIGEPCSGPDCDDPLAKYVPYPECGLTDQMDNRADASWLSCVASASPIPAYGNKHWLQYDLGNQYRIWSSHIWNYNVSGSTNEGFEEVSIDYSMDGVNWTNLGTSTWAEASGDDDYSGFIGPDFGGITARYILVTAQDDIGSCRGISKMTFTTRLCAPEGSSCDDGDALTINDQFDDNCNCIGTIVTYNDCSRDTLILGDSTLLLSRYSAIKFLESSSLVPVTEGIEFVANEGIALNPGFTGSSGAILTLEIDDCSQVQSLKSPRALKKLKEDMLNNPLVVLPVPNSDEQIIGFYVNMAGLISLEVRDQKDNLVISLVDHHFDNPGYYTKRLRTKKLRDARYKVNYMSGNEHHTASLKVIVP